MLSEFQLHPPTQTPLGGGCIRYPIGYQRLGRADPHKGVGGTDEGERPFERSDFVGPCPELENKVIMWEDTVKFKDRRQTPRTSSGQRWT